MNPDAKLLRDTLELALSAEHDFAARFYHTLFARHPELRPMFHRNSDGAQRKMFAQKLAAIIDNIENPSWMQETLLAIARSHHDYGATPAMYTQVGAALLDTLRESCGDGWSEAAEAAWNQAYRSIADAILSVPPT